MKIKKYRWVAHYNKPLSLQKKKVMWSVKYRGKCYFTENINFVITGSFATKSNKTQPYAVIQGWATELIKTKNGIVIVERSENE